MTATVQPDLQWRPPAPVAAPTVEPTPDKFRRAPGDPRDYRAEWEAFVAAHSSIATYIEELALAMAGRGRVEVNALFTMARARYLATLDNSLRASCSDWLIERNPELAAVIKRRARKRTAAKAVAP